MCRWGGGRNDQERRGRVKDKMEGVKVGGGKRGIGYMKVQRF